MAIIEETDKSKRGERERWMAPEVSKAVLTPKIINFEQGRKALEKRALEEEQSEVDKEHSFARGFTLGLVGTFAKSRCCWAFTSDSLVRSGFDQAHRRHVCLRAAAGMCRGAPILAISLAVE
jgi:hypothetical protein